MLTQHALGNYKTSGISICEGNNIISSALSTFSKDNKIARAQKEDVTLTAHARAICKELGVSCFDLTKWRKSFHYINFFLAHVDACARLPRSIQVMLSTLNDHRIKCMLIN